MTADEVMIEQAMDDMKTYHPLVSLKGCIKALLCCSYLKIGCSDCPYRNVIQCSSTKDKDAFYYLCVQNNM